jgi:hypothetical protein
LGVKKPSVSRVNPVSVTPNSGATDEVISAAEEVFGV